MDHKVLLLIGNALLAERTSGLGIGKIG